MFIELRGVEFVNKGAELMLHAIISTVRIKFPEAQFVMERNNRSPKNKLDENHIWEKVRIIIRRIDFSMIAFLLPITLLTRKRLVTEKEISVVLDASGFAYGDKWGAAKAAGRAGNHIRKWKKQGKKVVFLPQAFGPFSTLALQEEMRKIIENADLLFARDQQSFDYLNSLNVNRAPIKIAPDFTSLIQVDTSPYLNEYSNTFLIIPNQKMLKTENDEHDNQYLLFLKMIIERLQAKGETTAFLIHEAHKDGQLAAAVNGTLSTPIPIVEQEDPLAVKAIIGASKGVVTSRFHGLVSSLAQAIPCLSTGWTHKYGELMKDYSFQSGMCEVSTNPDYLERKLSLIIDDNNRKLIRHALETNAVVQNQRAEKMWKEVFSLIDTLP
jgi:polysaccharide pyruvyl transferase WcaK-like protein